MSDACDSDPDSPEIQSPTKRRRKSSSSSEATDPKSSSSDADPQPAQRCVSSDSSLSSPHRGHEDAADLSASFGSSSLDRDQSTENEDAADEENVEPRGDFANLEPEHIHHPDLEQGPPSPEPVVQQNEDHLREFQNAAYINHDSDVELEDGPESESSDSDGDDLEDPEEDIPDPEEEVDSDPEEGAAQRGLPGHDPPLYMGAPITLGQSLLAILTFSVVHNLTGVALADLLTLVALHCIVTDNVCKRTLHTFRKYFLQIKSPLKFHYFCSLCYSELQTKNDQCDGANCGEGRSVSYFIEISIIGQLQQMFKNVEFLENLSFRHTRVKKMANNYEDVYDGNVYKEKIQQGFFANPYNLSFSWNTDGVKIWKSNKLQLWPFFLVVNELPYRMRFKKQNCIIAGLWVSESKPRVDLFVNSFREELNRLHEGVEFEVPGNRNIQVKATVICGTCDSPAKALFLNMKQHGGHFSCPKCKIRGEKSERTDNSFAYPFSFNNPARNIEETNRYAELAERFNHTFFGVKGKCELALYVTDYIKSTSIDVMHCVYEGVVKKLVIFWFHEDFKNCNFSLYDAKALIDQLLVLITPPSFVRRLPRTISEHLSFWKAQEFKSFLFLYSLPLLSQVMSPQYFQHHMLLVHGIYLLNQETISEEMVVEAERCLNLYVRKFHELYNIKYLSLNVHMLLHLAQVTRDLGPLWVTSCMPLENLNGEIKRLVHGTKDAPHQISSGLSQIVNLPILLAKLNDDDPVKNWCNALLSRSRLRIAENIGGGLCTVGKYVTVNNIPPLIAGALCDAELVGNVTQFFRLKKGKLIFHSLSYTRQTKALSHYVKFSSGNHYHYGVVHTFIKLSQCDCIRVCECPGEYFAIVERYDVEFPFRIQELDIPVTHVMKGTTAGIITAVPVAALVTICMFTEIQNVKYIVHPVNTLEDE